MKTHHCQEGRTTKCFHCQEGRTTNFFCHDALFSILKVAKTKLNVLLFLASNFVWKPALMEEPTNARSHRQPWVLRRCACSCQESR